MNQGGMVGAGMSVGNPSSLTMAGGTMTMTNGKLTAASKINLFVCFIELFAYNFKILLRIIYPSYSMSPKLLKFRLYVKFQ